MDPAERSIESMEHAIPDLHWVLSAGGEALAKFLGKARFGHYESNSGNPII